MARTIQRRLERRFKRHHDVIITIADGEELTCRLVDRSEMGARLVVSSSIKLPGMFDITFVPRTASRPARLVWRNGSMAGIAFVAWRAKPIRFQTLNASSTRGNLEPSSLYGFLSGTIRRRP